MSSDLTLWAFDKSPGYNKALVAAEYAKVNLTVNTKIEAGVTLKTPEFTALNPNQKVPVLITEKGPIWESNAIARYISRIGTPPATFLGTTSFLTSQIDQWIDWTRGELEIQLQVWLYPIFGYIPNNQQATELAKEDVKRALSILNEHLKLRSFLVGDRLSLADIVVALTLLNGFRAVFDGNFRKPFPNVTRWFTTVVNQPNVVKVIGEVELCQKMQVAPQSAEQPAAEKKAPAKQQQQPKKEAPKKEAKKKEEEDDGLLEEEKPQPKKANPLDSLPPSSFNLEEWKRVYSNEKDTRKACQWFWEKFDRNGFSLWFCKYKYNHELDVIFKSCNLMGGFIQRLESLRKYGFASLLLFGTDGNLEISGAFVVRGISLPEEVTGCPDYTSYDFTPVNIDDEKDRLKFDDYLCWDGTFGGLSLPFAQGKTFK